MDYSALILNLTGDMSLIALTAYLIGRNRYITTCAAKPGTTTHWLTLTAIFSGLSILGTYNGIPVEGAFANTRMVGTLMSGIMGGPYVGFSVGVISGTHRYLVGGFTAETCAVATVLGGLCAGIIRHKHGLHKLNWGTAALVAFLAEVLQKSMVLLFAKPFEAAWALEKIIAIPTTLVTVLGTVIFMLIIKDIHADQESHSAKAAELSLRIAGRTLPYLRHGLTAHSAAETAKIIYELTNIESISITDTHKVLAFIGLGADHHLPGEAIMTESTRKAITEGELIILLTPEERGCPVDNCPLKSAVVAPLIAHGTVVGTIKLSRAEQGGISEVDARLAAGIANLLSVQIELAEIDAQRKMREKAELKALRAQINPHFLFNTLNIIMSFCRTNPGMARNLLGNLSTMLQYSFAKHEDMVSLQDELNEVTAYLEIIKARFGSRLQVHMRVEDTSREVYIPVLSIQPLIENAVQHGLFPKLTDCVLTIDITVEGSDIIIAIVDNGIGIDEVTLSRINSCESDGIGIQNVHKRLQSIFGSSYGLTLTSQPGEGTTAIMRIPNDKAVMKYAI